MYRRHRMWITAAVLLCLWKGAAADATKTSQPVDVGDAIAKAVQADWVDQDARLVDAAIPLPDGHVAFSLAHTREVVDRA